MLVFFSTIVFGALMPVFIKFFRKMDPVVPEVEHTVIEMKNIGSSVDFGYLHPNFTEE